MNELPGCDAQSCENPISSRTSSLIYDGGASCFCTTSLNEVIALMCTAINQAANSYTDLQAQRAVQAILQNSPSITFEPNNQTTNKVRANVVDSYIHNLFTGGAGIQVNPANGQISNTGVTSWNGQHGDITFVDQNNFPISLTFLAGTLTLTRNNLADLSVSLDGRYINVETDPVATAKTITLNQGTGITITGGAQTIGANPSFTITNSAPFSNTAARLAISGTSPISYDNTTGIISHITTGVVPGTYNTLIVNAFGLITSASNTSYVLVESDPVFTASVAHGIGGADVAHWNTAYNKFPTAIGVSGTTAKTITLTLNDGSTISTVWSDLDNNNYVSGIGFAGGTLTLNRVGLPDLTQSLDGRYLQSYTESDPVFVASVAHGITGTNVTNWNTAFNKFLTGGVYATGTITFTRNDLTTFGVTIPVTLAPNTQLMFGTGTSYTSSANLTYASNILRLDNNGGLLLNYSSASTNLRLWSIGTVTDPSNSGSFFKIGSITDAGSSIDSSHDNQLVINRNGWVGLGTASVQGTERFRVIGDTYHDGLMTIATLASGGTAPTTTGTLVMVVADQNGKLSFATAPSGANNFTTSVALASGTLTVNRNGLSALTAAINLDQIGQVAITSVANNQLLKYNTGTSKWENWTPSYIVAETDPIFVASTAHSISATDVSHWNAAYNKYPTAVAVTGTTTKTVTITLNDSSTLTTTFTDISSGGTTTLTATQIAFGDGSNVLTSSSQLAWTGTKLQLGVATSGSITPTPININLGSTFSNTTGGNLKLKLYDDGGGVVYGLGVSTSQMDYVVEATADHVFYVGSSEAIRIFHDKTLRGAIYAGTGNRLAYLDLNGVFQRSTLDPATIVLTSRTITINGVTQDLATNRSWTISTGSGGVSDAYSVMSDGTNTSAAVASDTFRFRSANNLLSVLIQNNDVTFGDNLLLTVNQANIQITESQVTSLTSDLSFKVPTSRLITINGTSHDLNSDPSFSVGTVTSIAATIPASAIAISGSPITSTGTLGFTWTGTSAQYIAGDGSKITFPTVPVVSGTAGRIAEFTATNTVGNSNWTHYTTGGVERYGMGTVTPGAAFHIESVEGNVFQLSRTGIQLFLVGFDAKTTIGGGDVTGTPAGNKLNVIQDNSTSGTNLLALFRANQTAATTGSMQAMEGYVKSSNGAATNVNLTIGTVGNAEHAGIGTIGTMRGMQAGIVINGNGNVSIAQGLFIAPTNIASGTSTVTDNYGLYVSTFVAGSGTLTNKYNIFTQDTTGKNVLNGPTLFPTLGSPTSNRLTGMLSSTGEITPVTLGTNLTLSGNVLNATGEANTASNVAATQNTSINAGIYQTKSGVNLLLKSVSSPIHGGITINGLTNEVEIKNNAYDQYDTATSATTGATSTAITTITIPSGVVGWVEFETVAGNTTVTCGAKMIVWFAKTGGGTLTVTSSNTVTSYGGSIGTTSTAISSNSLQLVGTGTTGNNLQWAVVYKVRILGLS